MNLVHQNIKLEFTLSKYGLGVTKYELCISNINLAYRLSKYGLGVSQYELVISKY